MDWLALKAELLAGHPVSGAYSVDPVLAAAQINALDLTRIKENMTGSEVWDATDATDFAALTEANRQLWLSFCAVDNHDPQAGGLAQQFVQFVFGQSATLSNLAQAREESVSRATILGFGTITPADIDYARTQ